MNQDEIKRTDEFINDNSPEGMTTPAKPEFPEAKTDYNEPLKLAKQRVAIVERVMKLPYIKAIRDTTRGDERFVCRDDVIKAVHDWASEGRGHE